MNPICPPVLGTDSGHSSVPWSLNKPKFQVTNQFESVSLFRSPRVPGCWRQPLETGISRKVPIRNSCKVQVELLLPIIGISLSSWSPWMVDMELQLE